ncbi:M13 family metallopeptidase [Parerythrobacter aurantius]|uniref:M13 family metallopeptidase n=1 Tax=Parerythrobacter aurantius TaxID=3127706 RepID=UPI0032526CCB
MIRTVFATTASALALALAAPALAADDGDSIDLLFDDAAPEAAPQPATPTMSFGTWGVDTSLLSDTIKPGDDFFGYVNQEWLDANPLPAEYSRFGAFNLLAEKSTSDVKALIDEMAAQAESLARGERRVIDAYRAYADTAAIEAAGLAPAKPYLAAIGDAGDLEALVRVWATPGMPSPVNGFVTVDQKAPDSYVTYVGSGGLGLPDRDYYSDQTERGQTIQQKYREYLQFLLSESGHADPAAAAAAVYAFEERIAREISWDRTVSRNRDLTYNAATPAELAAMAGGFPLAATLQATGFDGATKFVVPQVPPSDEEIAALGLTPEVVAKIGKGTPGMFALLAETSLETLKAWTVVRFLSGNAAVLPERFDKAQFALFGTLMTGTPEQRPRWKRAIGETEGLLGEVVGKAYVARHFPAENKAAMDALVANLRTAMAQSIAEIDWMGTETKAQARAKLESFDPKIGYRDNLETYEGLEIGSNPIANRMAAAKWGFEDNLAKLGKPIDRTEWGMLPQTVNAYYNATKNEIVFPAGILQQPFFALTNDPAVNYGAIGGVIGHEMGHGFDDQGSKSDATGELRNWWTDADRAEFDKRGDKLVEQYNKFCPLDDGTTCLNGRLSLGENIGDVGGLSLAYRAYKLSLGGKEDKVIDGLTGDQRFFIAWAQVWRAQSREDAMRQRIRLGPHSLEQFRTNGVVRNMDAWYDAFGITPDDPMYLPPEQRVRIW